MLPARGGYAGGSAGDTACAPRIGRPVFFDVSGRVEGLGPEVTRKLRLQALLAGLAVCEVRTLHDGKEATENLDVVLKAT